MTSDDFLINHAYANAWCAPEQDRQYIFRPARLSPPIGVRGSTDLVWSRHTLPTQGDWYHLFQIGPVIYENLGLDLDELTWTTAGLQMVKNRLIVDVYLESGKMIPREHVFFFATPDGNLAVAIKDTKLIGDFGREDVFIRVYSNAYFERSDDPAATDGIEYRYVVPTSTDSISTLARNYREMLARPGATYAFINGWKVQNINIATVKRGDLVELLRDSSIKSVLEIPISDLEVFLSELDGKQKYFLHQTNKVDEVIDYRDDLDIYLIKRTNPNTYAGVLFHKNSEDAVRMVTHRDYSIPVAYVERIAQLNAGWGGSMELSVQLVIRKAGLENHLIDESHHIRELYKLKDDEIIRAMIGTEATVDVWKAANLELSAYPAIMRAISGTVTRSMVEKAYGYNAISKLMADTPQRIVNVNGWVELPWGLRGESTVYEYDANGILLDYYVNTASQWYIARNKACSYIEAIVGRGSDTPTTVYAANATIPDEINYRCYVCDMVNGYPNGQWRDVTGNPEYHTVVNRQVLWVADPKKFFTAVKFDDSFLTYDLTLDYQDGLLRFSLNVIELRVDGTPYTDLNEIPVGVLEIWLEGHPIIEGLDWFMHDKEICIVNKNYRNKVGTSNKITIRATGFCNADMTRITQEEFGFVEQGWLSRNNRWNLRDDKIVRLTAGGRLYSRAEVSWSEDRPWVKIDGVVNGVPYQVIEPVVPLRGGNLSDMYVMRELARETDHAIENYMTERMGDIPLEGPNLIPGPHELYSPFIGKLMHDLLDGFIREEDIDQTYGDMLVKQICKPYEWLLKYEPTTKGLDTRYVNVHPHERYTTFELGLYQYNFLRRAIRLYLDDKVNISQFISIKSLGPI